MTSEEKENILKDISSSVVKKGRLLYSYEIRPILDKYVKDTQEENDNEEERKASY